MQFFLYFSFIIPTIFSLYGIKLHKKLNDLPLVTITSNETIILNLNDYYSGDLLDYEFYFNRTDNLTKEMTIQYDPKIKNLTVDLYYFQNSINQIKSLFQDCDGYVYYVKLINSSILKLFSLIKFDNETINYSQIDSFNISKNFSCKNVVLITNLTFLLFCEEKNGFLLNKDTSYLLKINIIKDKNTYQFQKNYSFWEINFESDPNFFPQIQYQNSLIFIYYKSSNCVKNKGVTVYQYINENIIFYDKIDEKKIPNLNIQSLIFSLNKNQIFLLDHIKGLLILNYSNISDIKIEDFKMIDSKYYGISLIKKNKNSLLMQDNKAIIVISSWRYLTELQVTYQNENSDIIIEFVKRIKYPHYCNTLEIFYSDSHYFILNDNNNENNKFPDNFNNKKFEKQLFVYDRHQNESYLVIEYKLKEDDFLFYAAFNNNFFSTMNIFVLFNSTTSTINFLKLSNPTLIMKCCSNESEEIEKYFQLNFTVTSQNSYYLTEKEIIKDYLFIIIFNINDPSVKFYDNRSNFTFRSSFPSFNYDFEQMVRGPNKIFQLKSKNKFFSGIITNSYSEKINIITNDLIYYEIIRVENNDINFYITFFQFKNYMVNISKCFELIINCGVQISIQLSDLIEKIYVDLNEIAFLYKNLKNIIDFYSFHYPFIFKYEIMFSFSCDFFFVNKATNYAICINNNIEGSTWYGLNLFTNESNRKAEKIYFESNVFYDNLDLNFIENNVILVQYYDMIRVFIVDDAKQVKYFNSIQNEILRCNACSFYCFNFISTFHRSNGELDAKLVVINYDQNKITVLLCLDTMETVLLRRIPLYYFKLYRSDFKPVLIRKYLVLKAININNIVLLIYDLEKQTENTLIKMIELDNDTIISIISLSCYLEENLSYDNGINYLEFILKNDSFYYYKVGDYKFYGYFFIPIREISGEVVNNSLHFNTTDDISREIDLQMNVSNDINSNKIESVISIYFDFDQTFLNYSNTLLKNLGNITNIKYHRSDKYIKLYNYFSGPIINYDITSLNEVNNDYFYLKTMITMNSNFNLSRSNLTEYSDSIQIENKLFVLNTNFLMIYDVLNKYKLIETLFINSNRCLNLYIDRYNSILFLKCTNSNENELNTSIYYLNLTSIPFQINELPINIDYIDDIKYLNNTLFIVKKVDENLWESSIMIYSLSNIDNKLNITFISDLNASSFALNYLHVDSLNVKELNCGYDCLNYGLLFTDEYYIRYCEFTFQITNLSNFNISKTDSIRFLDILDKLDDFELPSDNNYTKIINIFWKKIKNLSYFRLIIASQFHIIELSINKMNFNDFNISMIYYNYLQCINLDEYNFEIENKFLINICNFQSEHNYENKKTTYLTLYSMTNNFTYNSLFNISHVSEAMTVKLAYIHNFFLNKKTIDSTSQYYVSILFKNMTINEYYLNDSLYLLRNENSTFQGDNFSFFAFNDYSNISIKISLYNNFSILDATLFVGLVILPLIISISMLICSQLCIKWNRHKRREILADQYEQFVKCRSHHQDFEVWLGSQSNLSLEQI